MARVVRLNPDKERQADCEGCCATIAYTKNEVGRRDGIDISGGPDGEEWVNCPNCGKKIILKIW